MTSPTTPAVPVTRRVGFEVELLAPRGASRADLAEEVARRCGGTVEPFFHTDGEPSLVPGMTHFIHLTQGFAVRDAGGEPVCRLVDDITLRSDLDARARPRPGWYRILSDEPRLMRLVHRYADPAAPLEKVLDRLADVFGVRARHTEGVVTVEDEDGATIAMAAPLPGEMERPCEVVTPPLVHDHRDRLEQVLRPARELGFTVPAEAAVHLHLDADPLRQVPTFANLVRLFSAWRPVLHQELATNPRCRRLAPLPEAVVRLVDGPLPRTWSQLCEVVAPMGLVKFADVNLTALVAPRPRQDTVEIRCLPGSIHGDDVEGLARLVERLVDRCRRPEPIPRPRPGDGLEVLLGA